MKHLTRILVVILLIGLLAPCISAEGETLPFTYTVENGEVTLNSYTGPQSGTLVIPDEIDGNPVTDLGHHLFQGMPELEVTLPKYLKRIETYALTLTGREVTIPATVTSIGPRALNGAQRVICEKYSAADQYARTYGIPVTYTVEDPDVQVVEEDGFTFWIKDGEATLAYSISTEENTLYIPAYVDDCPVTRIASYVTPYSVEDSYTQNIYTSIVVPATVKQIDSYAFYNRNQYRPLRSVFLCEGVETVGDYAFYDSDTSIGSFIYLTLPNSLKSFGENEGELWNAYWIRIFAAENSCGAQYAQRAGATFINNHADDGTITGNYAGLDFRIQNGEATVFDAETTCGWVDPALPSYIDTYPLTRIETNALADIQDLYAVLPPTLTELDDYCFGNIHPEHCLLLYYPGTPAEKLVKEQPYPYMSIYEALPLPYDDVPADSWYYGAVSFAYYYGLMNGVAETRFDPNGTMTRAMLVTVLCRLDGGSGSGSMPFTDVPKDAWFAESVIWATENGIVNGVGGGKFDPNGRVTREQIATILFRYAEYRGLDVSARTELSRFADAGKVSAYAKNPMQWAAEVGIIGGRSANGGLYLAPQDSGTRAEVAAILMRFLTNPF